MARRNQNGNFDRIQWPWACTCLSNTFLSSSSVTQNNNYYEEFERFQGRSKFPIQTKVSFFRIWLFSKKSGILKSSGTFCHLPYKGVVNGIGETVKRAIWRQVGSKKKHVGDAKEFSVVAHKSMLNSSARMKLHHTKSDEIFSLFQAYTRFTLSRQLQTKWC